MSPAPRESEAATPARRRFENQVVLVTGASRGIGAAIAQAFGQEGALVGINYAKRRDAAEAVAAAITGLGGRAELLEGDVADPRQVDAMVEALGSRADRIDVLVNCAGIIRDGLAMTLNDLSWREVIDTNLGGTFNTSRAVARRMLSRRRGRIINVSSISSSRGRKGQASYAASKAAVEALTRVLALELAGKGVTVNAVCPGLIATEMIQGVQGMAGQDLAAHVPLKRLGAAEDIAKAVLFLASDDAAYVTGTCLTVDGGLSLGLGF